MEDIDRFLEKKISILKLNSSRESQKANSFLTFVFNSENRKYHSIDYTSVNGKLVMYMHIK